MSCQKHRFRLFYNKTVSSLSAFYFRLGIRDKSVVEDLIQETYIEAFQGWSKLRSQGAAKSWLFTIAKRRFIRHLEREKRVGFETLTEDLVGPSLTVDQVAAREACQLVLHRLSCINNQKKREVVQGYFIEQKSMREISETLGVNLSTVTTWCSRFSQECRMTLEKRESTPNPAQRSLHHIRARKS